MSLCYFGMELHRMVVSNLKGRKGQEGMKGKGKKYLKFEIFLCSLNFITSYSITRNIVYYHIKN